MTDLNKYRDFFQSQGFGTRTYCNGDDNKMWWCLEINYNSKIYFLNNYNICKRC